MLLMVIFAFMSAGLFYASRVPAVQSELSVLAGEEASSGDDDVSRLAHITFIMFTFTSPLLLAGLISSGLALLRWINRGK